MRRRCKPNRASLVKACPNSQMEAVVCGRPVPTSPHIPMAGDVRRGIDLLMRDYAGLQRAASVLRDHYSRERWQKEPVHIYAQVGKRTNAD